MSNAKAGGRLAGLEVLRGLAASGIVLFHLHAIYLPVPEGWIRDVVKSLSAAVPLFFALSAFSLLFGYADRLGSTADLVRFYTRRAFRILPLFYALLAFQLLRELYQTHWISLSTLVVNLLFLFPFFPGQHESLVWAGWSLGVEWLFYLIFPLMVLLARSVRASAWALLLFWIANIAVARVSDSAGLVASYRSMSLPANLLYFLSGTLAYALLLRARRHGQDTPLPRWVGERSGLALLASLLLLALLKWAVPASWQALLPWSGISAMVILLWVLLAHAGLPRWMSRPGMQTLGAISYGTYLIHPVVLWALQQQDLFAALVRLTGSALPAFACASVLTLLLVWGLALASLRWLESPAIRWGERWLQGRSSRSDHGDRASASLQR